MRRGYVRFLGAAIFATVAILVGFNLTGGDSKDDEGFHLRFGLPAEASGLLQAGGGAFPDSSAGIGAIVKLPNADLDVAINLLPNPAGLGQNYVYGSYVPVSNGVESTPTWAYVDTDGWVVVYFTHNQDAQMSRLLNWGDPAGPRPSTADLFGKTTLSQALGQLVTDLGFDYTTFEPTVTHYWFTQTTVTSIYTIVKYESTTTERVHTFFPTDFPGVGVVGTRTHRPWYLQRGIDLFFDQSVVPPNPNCDNSEGSNVLSLYSYTENNPRHFDVCGDPTPEENAGVAISIALTE